MLNPGNHRQQGIFEGLNQKVESTAKHGTGIPKWVHRTFKLELLNQQRMFEAISTQNFVHLGESAFLIHFVRIVFDLVVVFLMYKLDGWYVYQMVALMCLSYPAFDLLLGALLLPIFVSSQKVFQLHRACPRCGCTGHAEDP